eukprot:TRINITY_DN67468_c6_g1_i1.p1 TRINITY_DN67468_c6_g1~~TRINITY_DN67468_c6_g1_i1.p1  ORF type:complete len:524 (+),score=299.66 TRINITY_DN67468_c6_g1_i1:46-1617(+)
MSERMIGDWVLGRTLGEGGFSKVKLGYNPKTGQKAALKLLKKNRLNANSSVRKQVEKEIASLQRVKHENVVRMLDVDWDAVYVKKNGKRVPVILTVLELASGGELFDFLSFTGSFEEAVARTYFHQLISGLEACHKVGVSHRDLKPENLLLGDGFLLKLADFGFAGLFDDDEYQQIKTMQTQVGTPSYMAPEIFANQGYDPTKVDIWACGVILFIMLSGFPPYQRPDATDWWFNKLATNRQSLFWQAHSRQMYFSDGIKDMINKMLYVDPKHRITITDIKKHTWFNGPTISQATLVTELQKRKDIIDREKAREAQARSAAAMSEDNLTDEDELNRDIEDDGKLPEPAVYDADNTVRVYTRFFSKKAAPVIVKRVARVFEKLQYEHSVDAEAHKIKASAVGDNGTVQFQMQVFRAADDPSLQHVEFRRRRGDAMQFRKLYQLIEEQVPDLIAAAPGLSSLSVADVAADVATADVAAKSAAASTTTSSAAAADESTAAPAAAAVETTAEFANSDELPATHPVKNW